MPKLKKNSSSGPTLTRESLHMMSVARKNINPKKKWEKPTRVKIKFVLAVFIFCFLASCFSAYFAHSFVAYSITIEILIIVSLILSYLGLRINLKNQYKKTVSIVLMVINILALFVSACELYYFTAQ